MEAHIEAIDIVLETDYSDQKEDDLCQVPDLHAPPHDQIPKPIGPYQLHLAISDPPEPVLSFIVNPSPSSCLALEIKSLLEYVERGAAIEK